MLIYDMKCIGKNLSVIRAKKNMTQFEVAEKANISERTYAEIERGNTNMRMETLLGICTALSITPNDFLVVDDEKLIVSDVLDKLQNCTTKEKNTAINILNSYLESL